ncbi:MAG: acetyl xylan esterase family protein [Acidimicrobiia bacterium]|jgi:cephalosporin-C deacetylase|nr:acetyl xylan esterase family protein [Acidimicrobiia bacterium]
MAHFDLPLEQLRTYSPTVEQPDDFDGFWSTQLEEASRHGIEPTVEPAGDLIKSAEVLDVRFSGHGGARVAAWLYLPHEIADRAPVVVEYIGYNGGRGRPIDWLRWSSVGYPHLVVDSRGQGGKWRSGDTADPGDTGEPGSRGFVTRGLSDPNDHYYSRLFVDAARAVEATRAIDSVADRPVVVCGGSQGGALALAAASLSQRTSVVLADVPFLSDFRRAVAITDAAPFSEIRDYCATYPDRVGPVFKTLSYFDVVNHAKRVTSPSLFSVALMDEITPPSTVFAAFNNLAGERSIEVYEFNGHEGGGSVHFEKQVQFVREHLG